MTEAEAIPHPDYLGVIQGMTCDHDLPKQFSVLVTVDLEKGEVITPHTTLCFHCLRDALGHFSSALHDPDIDRRPTNFEVLTPAGVMDIMRGRPPVQCTLPAYGEDLDGAIVALDGDEQCDHQYFLAPRPTQDQLQQLVGMVAEHIMEHPRDHKEY